MATPAPSHQLNFAVPAPYIAACSRCGRLLKHLAEVGAECRPAKEEECSKQTDPPQAVNLEAGPDQAIPTGGGSHG